MKPRQALFPAALLAATPAEAATYLITYTGTVASGYDDTGEFLAPGSIFNGEAFTAVMTLIAPLPGALGYDNGVEASIYGGAGYPAPSPMSGTITINGVTRVFSGDWESLARHTNMCCAPGYGGLDRVYHDINDYNPDWATDGAYLSTRLYFSIQSYSNDFLATQDYTAPLTYTIQPGDEWEGGFLFSEYSNSFRTVHRNAQGRLNPSTVTIALADVGAVPEPATWAMMLAGFGMVGFAMRRRSPTRMRVSYA